jgi:glycosyltransferase involved in cell wall biosynthesis
MGLEQFALPGLFTWYDNIYFRIMIPLFCHYANSIIVMTNFGKNELIKYLKVRSNKIEVINESYHKRFEVKKTPEKLSELKQKYNLLDRFILFVGRIAPLKNISNIIRAFNIVRKKFSVKLVLVGWNRLRYTKVLGLIDRLKLQSDIKILGFVPDDDLPYLYNLAQ